ncbi:MAG: hypothetical protein IPL35_14030 [Sphingobacteriales bacterium]|nr:hypothetical protein [Sphingobacteriales bacterium]
MKHILLVFTLLITAFQATAQEEEDSLLDALGPDEPETEYVISAFKSPRVINAHSMEMLHKGALDFRILHRFSELSGGAYEFFGLDGATIRLGLDYGISKNFTVGVGRSSYRKEIDAYAKYRLAHQSKGKRVFPVSVILVSGITYNTLKWSEPERENYFTSRLAYYHQLIVGRKFSDAFTLQLAPTLVHRNLIADTEDKHDIYSLGIGSRLRLSRRVALTLDYFYVANGYAESVFYNPLSIGFDIETGGHVFQLHFSNTSGMNERAFITETANDFTKGDIHFGFNISRIFQIN